MNKRDFTLWLSTIQLLLSFAVCSNSFANTVTIGHGHARAYATPGSCFASTELSIDSFGRSRRTIFHQSVLSDLHCIEEDLPEYGLHIVDSSMVYSKHEAFRFDGSGSGFGQSISFEHIRESQRLKSMQQHYARLLAKAIVSYASVNLDRVPQDLYIPEVIDLVNRAAVCPLWEVGEIRNKFTAEFGDIFVTRIAKGAEAALEFKSTTSEQSVSSKSRKEFVANVNFFIKAHLSVSDTDKEAIEKAVNSLTVSGYYRGGYGVPLEDNSYEGLIRFLQGVEKDHESYKAAARANPVVIEVSLMPIWEIPFFAPLFRDIDGPVRLWGWTRPQKTADPVLVYIKLDNGKLATIPIPQPTGRLRFASEDKIHLPVGLSAHAISPNERVAAWLCASSHYAVNSKIEFPEFLRDAPLSFELLYQDSGVANKMGVAENSSITIQNLFLRHEPSNPFFVTIEPRNSSQSAAAIAEFWAHASRGQLQLRATIHHKGERLVLRPVAFGVREVDGVVSLQPADPSNLGT